MAIWATVSPYRATRKEVRSMVGSDQFVDVFVARTGYSSRVPEISWGM